MIANSVKRIADSRKFLGWRLFPCAPNLGEKNEFKETQTTAQALKTMLQYFPVTNTNDIDKAFDDIAKEHSGGVLTFSPSRTL